MGAAAGGAFLLRRTHVRYIAISHYVAQSTIREGPPPVAVEVIYRGMPDGGLGAAADHVEAVRRELAQSAATWCC